MDKESKFMKKYGLLSALVFLFMGIKYTFKLLEIQEFNLLSIPEIGVAIACFVVSYASFKGYKVSNSK